MNAYGFIPDITCQTLNDQENDDPTQNYNNIYQDVSYNLGSIIPPPNIDPTDVPDIPDTCFNYITQLLRDEYCSSDDPFDTPNATLHDYMAAQMSYNKSIDAALDIGENISYPILADVHHCPPSDVCPTSRHCLDDYFNIISSTASHSIMQDSMFGEIYGSTSDNIVQQGSNNMSNLYSETMHMQNSTAFQRLTNVGNSEVPNSGNDENVTDESRRRKYDDEKNEKENEGNGERRNKHSATCNDEIIEQIEQYGDVILCPEGRSKPAALCNNSSRKQTSADSSKGSKKRGSKGQFVDLRGLLTRCAQCIAQVDLANAYEMLKQIRQHSSPYGDFLQRVAHYLANGLEARLEGKGLELSRAYEEVSASEVLKANRIYVASVPYQIMSYYTMNKTIARLVEEAPSIHIIDFGIYYGLQWPCIIQNLSKRPNGPPRIRITGIDFPQRGFRPSERVEETGRCLAKYCEEYNVHFEYYPIAKKWEDVHLDELKIERNEPLVVNCLYRAHLLFDDSVEENSPREAFLEMVRRIKPDIFMHAIVNNTSSVPFFLNRFKEAMFHYSALFDIFESTMNREDGERMLLESKLYGPQALNVIACEGVERVERPESYKQWQVRTQRAGFEQVALDRELVRRARAMVKRSFREEFSYGEDGYWVVQGWKGRILYAISCWKPT